MKRYEVMQAKERPGGPWVRYEDAKSALAARDAEIERLKAELSENEGVIRVWRRRTEEAEALVEKRGYAMSKARQRIAEWHDLIESEADLDDSAGDAISVRDVVLKEMEETSAGLLAAIDEATESRPDRNQRRHQPD